MNVTRTSSQKDMNVLKWLFGTSTRHCEPVTTKHGAVKVTYFYDDHGHVSRIECRGRLRNGRTVSQARWSLNDRNLGEIQNIVAELITQVTDEIAQHSCETFGSTHATSPE